MYHLLRTNDRKRSVIISITLFVVVILAVFNSLSFATPRVQNRFDQLSNSGAGNTSNNLIGFTYTDTTDPVGSVVFTFCSNSPITSDTCTVPTGLDLSGAALGAQTGETNFSLLSNSGNTLIIDRNPTSPSSGTAASTYLFTGIVNPTLIGTYYLRIQTFSNQLGTGTAVQVGGVALSTTPAAFVVNSVVPPYLTFCSGDTISNIDCSTAAGDQINFGDFSPRSTSSSSSQFIVATNAKTGYSVTVSGNSLTSGNNVIPASTTPTNSRTGTSQFGINLAANTIPSVGSSPIGPGVGAAEPNYASPNAYLFNNGDEVATSSAASNYTKYTVSYVANVSSGQPAGVYATTVTFICLANF